MAWWNDEPSKEELARRRETEELMEQVRACFPGAVREVRDLRRGEESTFYEQYEHASPRQQRLELKRLQREQRRRQTPSDGDFARDILTTGLQIFTEMHAYQDGDDDPPSMKRLLTRLTDEQLQERIDFLEEQLQAPPQPQPEIQTPRLNSPRRSTPEELIARDDDLDEREARAIAACNGNEEKIARVRRIFYDERMRVMDES